LRLFFLTIAIVFALFGCSESEPDPETANEAVIAIVGDQVITQREFLQRAEYTIRPDYCKENHYIHKKIILNSLIAEKLYALEAEAMREIDILLQGRKEQMMRQLLLIEEGFGKSNPDTTRLLAVFDQAGRTYRLNYFSVSDPLLSEKLRYGLNESGIPFDTLYSEISNEPLPEREFSWADQDVPQLHEALYLQPVHKGMILGPFTDSDGRHLFVRVAGWTSLMAMGEAQVAQRWKEITDYVSQLEALKKYDSFAAGLMKGQQFQLNDLVFSQLLHFLAPAYLGSDAKKKGLLGTLFGNEYQEESAEFIPDINISDEAVLLHLNGKALSIAEFRQMVQRHPLTFRAKKLTKENFPQQLKFAIADLLRDEALNKAAQERGYEKKPEIQQTMDMWRNAYKARAHREKLLANLPDGYDRIKNEKAILSDILEPYTRSLQEKYSDKIQINTKLLAETELSTVDLLVLQPGQPWPVLVPAFPIYTQHNRLDYGKVLEP
jgi:hypothetical protein